MPGATIVPQGGVVVGITRSKDKLVRRGNVCPARARRANFLLTIPTSTPGLPSHGGAPEVDHVGLHTFPTKHIA